MLTLIISDLSAADFNVAGKTQVHWKDSQTGLRLMLTSTPARMRCSLLTELVARGEATAVVSSLEEAISVASDVDDLLVIVGLSLNSDIIGAADLPPATLHHLRSSSRRSIALMSKVGEVYSALDPLDSGMQSALSACNE